MTSKIQPMARFLAGWVAIVALTIAMFLAARPAEAQPANQATVTTALNLRGGPSTQYGVVLVMPAGATVTVSQCTAAGDWCEVRYNGRNGWTAARYLNFQVAASGTPTPPPASGPPAGQGQVTAQTTVTLNMREGPSTGYRVILAIPAGATVTVNRCTDGYAWCELTYRGHTGWSAARYLRATAPQYQQQPIENVGAQLGLQLFQFILDQIGQQQNPPPAQQRTPAANEVCFYRDFDYGGPVACARMGQSDESLASEWNDAISSIRVGANARVEVCTDFGYGGVCRTVSGDVARLPGELNDRISSFRTTQIGAGGPPQNQAAACFFADFGFQGASFCLNAGATVGLLDANWNDRISSLRIDPGLTVQVCRDGNFGGWCDEYTGAVPQLPGGRNDAISSIRVF